MSRLILGDSEMGTRGFVEYGIHVLVSIRKCFLLLNERVTAISIRGGVAIRNARSAALEP